MKMMKQEFEKIAGYEVSYETYSTIIEPMYNALPENVDKFQFVKMLDKKAFALPTAQSYLRTIRKEAKHLFEICGNHHDFESEKRLEKAAKDYMKRKYNIDWTTDMKAYCYFNRGYEYENMRGCSYPKELVIGRGFTDYERIPLIKEDTKY